MIAWRSIKQKLIVYIILSCMIPLFIGIFFVHNTLRKNLHLKYIERSSIMLEQAGMHVDSVIIYQTSQLLELIATDKRLMEAEDKLTNYLNYGSDEYRIDKSDEEIELETFFKQIKIATPQLTLISFGSQTGGYVEYPVFSPENPYDPRLRPWYINAIESDENVISEPYITSETGQLVISIAKKISVAEKSIGVLSLTIEIEDIVNSVNAISLDQSGEIIIISPNGCFINSPTNDEWLLRNVDSIENTIFLQVLEDGKDYFEGKISEDEKILIKYISPLSKWSYISIIDKDEIVNESKKILILMMVFAGIIMFSISINIIYISKKISDPITKLTNAILEISKFDFKSNNRVKWDNIKNGKDEIGKISIAMKKLESNFIELRQGLGDVSNQIEYIKLDLDSHNEMKLSSENPFISVATSVNSLLHKSREYLLKTRESEKKLKDQLHQISSQQLTIQKMAYQDHLTNLPNRRSFLEIAEKYIEDRVSLGIFLLDIDNFKDINDTLGHIFGDKVLIKFSQEINEIIHETVFVSRFGGDEFLFLYPDYKSKTDLENFAKLIFKRFNLPINVENNELYIRCCIGISVIPEDSHDIETSIRHADMAMYFCKNHGKQNYAFFKDYMEYDIKEKINIVSAIKDALENDGFAVLYQPQISLQSGKVEGLEALLRFKNYQYTPNQFIKVAENEGFIIQVGRKVTEIVIRQISEWINSGVRIKPVSINFSVGQLKDKYYVEYLYQLLEEYNVSSEWIVIEITETVFIEKLEHAVEFFDSLKNCGIKMAIDDFGSKYSPLNYLKNISVGLLKFDRQLCMHILNNYSESSIEILISFIHSLGLKVIAEGIEELSQVETLMLASCDFVQGYCFSKPVSPDQVEKIIQEGFNLPVFLN